MEECSKGNSGLEALFYSLWYRVSSCQDYCVSNTRPRVNPFSFINNISLHVPRLGRGLDVTSLLHAVFNASYCCCKPSHLFSAWLSYLLWWELAIWSFVQIGVPVRRQSWRILLTFVIYVFIYLGFQVLIAFINLLLQVDPLVRKLACIFVHSEKSFAGLGLPSLLLITFNLGKMFIELGMINTFPSSCGSLTASFFCVNYLFKSLNLILNITQKYYFSNFLLSKFSDLDCLNLIIGLINVLVAEYLCIEWRLFEENKAKYNNFHNACNG